MPIRRIDKTSVYSGFAGFSMIFSGKHQVSTDAEAPKTVSPLTCDALQNLS
jgi:hypothetical protein